MVEIITDPEALAEHRLTRFRILVCVDGVVVLLVRCLLSGPCCPVLSFLTFSVKLLSNN